MSQLNIALIGCGPRGVRGHGQKLRESAHFNLTAVCDLNETLAQSAAEALDCEAVTDFRKLLRRKTLDAVAIVTATEFHLDLALRAVKAGKHILLEKPLTHDFPSAVQLVRAAETAGVTGMVCYQLRFHPFYRALKEEAVRIQPVQLYSSRQCGVIGRKYLEARAQAGLLDFCSHDFDVARWLMDKPPQRVYASLGRGIYTETDAVDLLNVHLEFAGQPQCVAHVVSSMGGLGIPRRYDLVGRHGNVSQQGANLKRTLLTVSEEGRSHTDTQEIEVPAEAGDPTHLLHDHFAACLTGDTEKRCAQATFRDGALSLLIAEAAVLSDRTRRPVELEEYAAGYDFELEA